MSTPTPAFAESLVTNTHGRQYWIYTDDVFYQQRIANAGPYQKKNLIRLRDLKPNARTIIDVGANIGVHATAFASTGAEVHCFEPNPLNFAMLKNNTKGLGNVTLHNLAATNVAGDILIQTFDPAVAGNYGEMLINKETGVRAQAARLDDTDIPLPNLIKIDAEGSELGVIQGCLENIKKNLPLIYYEAQESPHLDKIYNILTDIGYHLYWGCIRNYNPGNFKNNAENIFGTSALFSVWLLCPLGGQRLKDWIQ